MAQAMNGLVDGVLQAFQERLAAVEMDYADLRGELVSIRRDLDALRAVEIAAPQAGMAGLERRVAQIERQLGATTVTRPGVRLEGNSVAEPMKLGATDIVIGVAILAVVLVAVFLPAGALSLPAPQWVLAAVAAAVGIIVWFAILRRRKA